MTPRPGEGKRAKKRTSIELGGELEGKLRSYTAAASTASSVWDKNTTAISAAGVASFALLAAIPSAAEVVYTPTTQYLVGSQGRQSLKLDINNDGQPDFALWVSQYVDDSSGVKAFTSAGAYGFGSNAVVSSAKNYDAALPLGAKIDVARNFRVDGVMAACGSADGRHSRRGPWVNAQNRYLGLKCQIDGSTHYGWARLTFQGCGVIAVTGYAYETVANRPLAAGVLPFANDSDAIPQSRPLQSQQASLALLAAGASGTSLWRRENVAGE